jgi:hypothetical protein
MCCQDQSNEVDHTPAQRILLVMSAQESESAPTPADAGPDKQIAEDLVVEKSRDSDPAQNGHAAETGATLASNESQHATAAVKPVEFAPAEDPNKVVSNGRKRKRYVKGISQEAQELIDKQTEAGKVRTTPAARRPLEGALDRQAVQIGAVKVKFCVAGCTQVDEG